MIIEAVGQYPDLAFLNEKGSPQLQLTKWNTLEAKEHTLQTELPYIFTGGDCFSGAALMVDAIAAGRYAARSIHYYLMDGEIPPISSRQKEFIPESLHKSIIDVKYKPRVHEPIVTLEDRLGTFKEVEGTIDEEDATYEAGRCLNCGVYCYDRDLEEEKVSEEEAGVER